MFKVSLGSFKSKVVGLLCRKRLLISVGDDWGGSRSCPLWRLMRLSCLSFEIVCKRVNYESMTDSSLWLLLEARIFPI